MQCNGALILATQKQTHERYDEKEERQKARVKIDEVENKMFKMTLEGETSNTNSKYGEALWERAPSKYAKTYIAAQLDYVPPEGVMVAPEASISTTHAIWQVLLSRKNEIDVHLVTVNRLLDSASPSEELLQCELEWFRGVQAELLGLATTDKVNCDLREAILSRLASGISILGRRRDLFSIDTTVEIGSSPVVNTGKGILCSLTILH